MLPGRGGTIAKGAVGRLVAGWPALAIAFAAHLLLLGGFLLKISLPPHGLFLMEASLVAMAAALLWRLRPGGGGGERERLFLALLGVYLLVFLQKGMPLGLGLLLAVVCLQILTLWLGRLFAPPLLLAVHFYFLRLFSLVAGTPFAARAWLEIEWALLGVLGISLGLFRAEQRGRRQAMSKLAGLAEEFESLQEESDQVKEEARAEPSREEKLAQLLARRGELLRRVLQLLHYTFRPHSTLLFLCDAAGETLRLKEGQSEAERLRSDEIAVAEGIFGLIWKQGGALSVSGLSEHFHGLVYYREPPPIRSLLAVPLKKPGGVRGVLLLDSLEEGAFAAEDQEIAAQAAEQIEGILDSASELAAYLDLKHELSHFYRASVALSRHLRMEEIMATALASLQEIVPFDFAAVVLHDSASGKNRIHWVQGEGAEALQEREFGSREELGLCSWVIRNQVPLDYHHQAGRRRQQVLFSRKLPQPEGLTALILLPLRGREAALGCLVLGSSTRQQYNREELKMAEVIANQVAITLHNGQMFAQVERLALTDGLTGLLNHRTFQEKLEQTLAFADRYRQTAALLMLDIDHFKSFNDLYGHPVGDFVLQRIARLLSASARKIDIVARYGGEEFALVLPNSERNGALATAERIRQRMEREQLRCDDLTLQVTVSIGVALYPEQSKTKEGLIEAADKALYLAKKRGRNRVVAAAASTAKAEQESFAQLLEKPHAPEEFM